MDIMRSGEGQQPLMSSYISLRDSEHQILTNLRHLKRLESPDSNKSSESETDEAVIEAACRVPIRRLSLGRPVPNTFLLFGCLPVFTVRACRRAVMNWVGNLLWPRAPSPCLTTTCGPVHHVRSCPFHPLQGGLPYQPLRKSFSI